MVGIEFLHFIKKLEQLGQQEKNHYHFEETACKLPRWYKSSPRTWFDKSTRTNRIVLWWM